MLLLRALSRLAPPPSRVARARAPAAAAALPSHAPASAAAGARAPARGLAGGGVLDALRGFVSRTTVEAKSKAKEALFKEQMAALAAATTYTLADHVAYYARLAESSGATGWRTMLMTEAAKAELAEQLVDLKIGAALTDAERAAPGSIDARARARLVAGVPTSPERVARFLDNYMQTATIHAWLRARAARGQAQPEDMTTFVHAMMGDQAAFRAASARVAAAGGGEGCVPPGAAGGGGGGGGGAAGAGAGAGDGAGSGGRPARRPRGTAAGTRAALRRM